MRSARLLALLMLTASAQAAPVRIEFWHAMMGVQDTVNGYAREFNQSQSQYEIVPVGQGNYRELLPKLRAALKAGKAPALAQLEFTQYPLLADEGQLTDLSKLVGTLPEALRSDLYPAVWKTSQVNGKTYSLPWNVTVPVLMYNAGTLKKAGINPPDTWSELEAVSGKLAAGGRRPLVAAVDAWTFEANVLSRGGSLVQGNKPALNSPEAVQALTQLARMSGAGLAQPRNIQDSTRVAFDFARGQNLFVMASVANWIDARKIPFFQLGIAPFPCQSSGNCTVSLGGAGLVMPRGTTAAQQAGALAFWQYLMEPARQADWLTITAYAPPRRAAVPLLEGWYAKNPQMRAAHAQVARAVPRPTTPQYAEWTTLIESALQEALTGKQSAKAALDEAQRQAAR